MNIGNIVIFEALEGCGMELSMRQRLALPEEARCLGFANFTFFHSHRRIFIPRSRFGACVTTLHAYSRILDR
jgi:hypothetical protein